jgi:hypothetical protein
MTAVCAVELVVVLNRASLDVTISANGEYAQSGVITQVPHYPERGIGRAKERVKGIEPSCQAWEACVLPLNYTRMVNWPEF